MSTSSVSGINNLPFAKQGQSEHTAEKQYGLRKVLGQWLGIIHHIKINALNGKYKPDLCDIAKRDILYIDMNSGSGWNSEVNCIGSPLLFLEESRRFDIKREIYFIESNVNSIVSLGERIREQYPAEISMSSLGSCDLLTGHHERILPEIIRRSGKRYGLVYHDPNGLPNFKLLSEISKHPDFWFVDILIRISGTNYKRIRNGLNGYGSKKNHPELVGKYPNLKDQLKTIKKRQWIIRDIVDPDPSQWTFLFGTNWTEYKAWEKEGFYKIDSSKGAAILNRVSYTIKELGEFGHD